MTTGCLRQIKFCIHTSSFRTTRVNSIRLGCDLAQSFLCYQISPNISLIRRNCIYSNFGIQGWRVHLVSGAKANERTRFWGPRLDLISGAEANGRPDVQIGFQGPLTCLVPCAKVNRHPWHWVLKLTGAPRTKYWDWTVHLVLGV